jgi:shikimate dehydrogenase
MNGKTQLVGIMGYPISQSKSPVMHNAVFAELGLNWAYVPLLVHPDHIKRAIKGLVALGFRGANVTAPHKETVLSFMNELSPSAHSINAVNTISITPEGKLIGDNTDASGFIQDLQENNVDTENSTSLILGAGGSSRAILYGLVQAGCPEAILLNRTLDKAAKTAQEIGASFPKANIQAAVLNEFNIARFSKANLIINCTSLGMEENVHEMPWYDNISFHDNQVIYDLIYNPSPTRFLEKAAQGGARILNGSGMLVHQGVLSFTIWTGIQPPIETMRRAISE